MTCDCDVVVACFSLCSRRLLQTSGLSEACSDQARHAHCHCSCPTGLRSYLRGHRPQSHSLYPARFERSRRTCSPAVHFPFSSLAASSRQPTACVFVCRLSRNLFLIRQGLLFFGRRCRFSGLSCSSPPTSCCL